MGPNRFGVNWRDNVWVEWKQPPEFGAVLQRLSASLAELGITMPDATDQSINDIQQILQQLNDLEEDNDA
jgi:hypothetical protein